MTPPILILSLPGCEERLAPLRAALSALGLPHEVLPGVDARLGLLETLGDAALTADPDDPEALAAAILRLARDPALRAALAERGLAQAARFAMPSTAARWTALREAVLASLR